MSDIVYLGRDGVDLYFNHAGNRRSTPTRLSQYPDVDDLTSITTAAVDEGGSAT